MPSQEEVDELKRRIAELEQEVTDLNAARDKVLADELRTDQTWGEFNPG